MRWLTGAALVLTVSTAEAADLSPDRWPRAELERLDAAERVPFPTAPRTLAAEGGLISATLSPFAVRAGLEALDQGGTAVDAAVTVALTQVATNLGAVVSYAGVATLVYYDARTGKTYVLDAGWGTYAGERAPQTIPAMDVSQVIGGPASPPAVEQGRKTLVPGFMAGMAAAHERFGRLPWRSLLQPAIWCAERGVTVSPLLAYYFQSAQGQLSRTAEGRRFLAQSGKPLPQAGDRFVQPEVASLLRAVARKGPEGMRRGPWARRYVEIVRREGGAVTLDDLAAYRPVWSEPEATRYGDATIVLGGQDGPVGRMIVSSLTALERQHVSQPYWIDPDSFVTYVRAFRQALAPPGRHSASVVAVDRWGNVAALVHSINSPMFGDTGIVVGGVPLSGAGGLYQARLSVLAPGAHVPNDMAPLIAFREDKPVLAIATVGSSLAPESTRLVVGLLSGGDPLTWAAAPPLLLPFMASHPDAEVVPAHLYQEEFLAALEARGIKLQRQSVAQTAALRGTAAFALAEGSGWRTVETPATVVFGGAR